MKNVAHVVLAERYEQVKQELRETFEIYNTKIDRSCPINRGFWKRTIADLSHQSYVLKKSIQATCRVYSDTYDR